MICARCSTSRIVTPPARICASASHTVSTHRRGQPQRGLVEQQHSRLGHQRAGDRQLLLLAAREQSGLAVAEFVHDRKQGLDELEVGVARRSPARGRPARAAGSRPRSGRGRCAGPPEPARCPSGRSARSARRAPSGPRTGSIRGSTGRAPITACSSVLLPAPLGPTSPTTSPAAMLSDAPRSAGTAP